MVSRNTWDNVVVVIRDSGVDSVWDGRVKSLVYDVNSLAWVAEASTESGIQTNTLIPFAYDYIAPTYNSTSDVFVYKSGGSSGSTVATLTITYTDSTKAVIQSVART